MFGVVIFFLVSLLWVWFCNTTDRVYSDLSYTFIYSFCEKCEGSQKSERDHYVPEKSVRDHRKVSGITMFLRKV